MGPPQEHRASADRGFPIIGPTQDTGPSDEDNDPTRTLGRRGHWAVQE